MGLMVSYGAYLPYAFLLFCAFSLLLALNALRPRFAPGPVALTSFVAGWLTAELALHALALQVAVLLVVMVAGGLRGWAGWTGLATWLATCVALAECARRGMRSRLAIEQALSELTIMPGPGPGAPAEGTAVSPTPASLCRPRTAEEAEAAATLAEAAHEAAVRPLSWRQLLFPLPFKPPSVELIRDVVYHRVGRLALKLDVYRPREASVGTQGPPRPALLFVHGGGWVTGDKRNHGLPVVHHMAERGWVCFTINYRLSPRATFPDHIVDVKRAIAWVREHGATYGAGGMLVICGGSAGAHLAALAALTPGLAELQPGFEHEDTRVDACVTFYGVYDFTDRHGHWPNPGLRRLLEVAVMKVPYASDPERYERASPIAHVHAGAPPFFVIHGDLDSLVPVMESRRFVAALRAVSRAPVLYAEIPGAQHAFEVFHSVRTAIVLDGVERVLRHLHDRHTNGAS